MQKNHRQFKAGYRACLIQTGHKLTLNLILGPDWVFKMGIFVRRDAGWRAWRSNCINGCALPVENLKCPKKPEAEACTRKAIRCCALPVENLKKCLKNAVGQLNRNIEAAAFRGLFNLSSPFFPILPSAPACLPQARAHFAR